MRPRAQRGARDHGTLVYEVHTRRAHGHQDGKRREPELPAVLLGRFEISNKPVFRPQVSARRQHKRAWRPGHPLDVLPHRTDEIRADHEIFPGQRRRVASVIHHRRHRRPLLVADPSHQQCVVAIAFRIVPAHVSAEHVIPVIPVCSHAAMPVRIGNQHLPHIRQCVRTGLRELLCDIVQKRLYQFAPRHAESIRCVPPGSMGVRKRHVCPIRPDPRGVAEGIHERRILLSDQTDQIQVRANQRNFPRRVHRRECQHVGQNRPMNPHCPVVPGRTPHSMVDPHRGRNIHPRKAIAHAGGGRAFRSSNHPDPLSVFDDPTARTPASPLTSPAAGIYRNWYAIA